MQIGVQHIVVLPNAGKALILCNGTLTFHSLPELSPAQNAPRPVTKCLWIGGTDLDEAGSGDEAEDNAMMALRSKMRLLTIGEGVGAKALDYPGCLAGARRGKYACVADSRSYALVDLENSQKIPLFPISSLDDTAISAAERQITRSLVSAQAQSPSKSKYGESATASQGHGRNTSLGALVSGLTNRQAEQRPQGQQRRSGLGTPEARAGAVSPVRSISAAGVRDLRSPSPNRPLPSLPTEASPDRTPVKRAEAKEFLQPHILSLLPTEFLLFTGTSNQEAGVGIFVNLDGDVVRGTLEFSRYPLKVAQDGGEVLDAGHHGVPEQSSDGFILAAVERIAPNEHLRGIEIQRWDVAGAPRTYLELPPPTRSSEIGDLPTIGVTNVKTAGQFHFTEIGKALRFRRLHLSSTGQRAAILGGQQDTIGAERTRNAQENEFGSRLGQAQARILTWYDDKIFWTTRNPILLRIDSLIQQVLDDCKQSRLEQARLIRIIKSLRNHDAQSETEFLSLEYVRQKISIILFADVAVNRDDVDAQLNEQLLMEAGADPRLILSMIPFLHEDIFEGPSGIWVHAGLVDLMHDRLQGIAVTLEPDEVLSRPEDFDVLGLVKRYLSAWRQRKGFGSIPDEAHVFATVDAALLHVLLFQDQQSHLGAGASSTNRAELYSIVDNPMNCFDRAVELLEEYRRLYVLSRLYQSRRMSKEVLDTWRRILEGAPDDGGGFTDGENEVKRYLINRSDRGLVEEYGTWLANRNPQLGVQVFTDDAAKVRIHPVQVVNLLRKDSPHAVKVYLEHLVFGKKNTKYANELIGYYLDSVLSVLSTSEDALHFLSSSYNIYRALPAPKPTYRQFITDAPVRDQWWADRIRLLELLGGSHGTDFTYDVATVLERIQPYGQALVPESIILEGQQGHHTQALRLLTHGLGDYHTAINYCLLGGASIFHPATPGTSTSTTNTTTTTTNSLTLQRVPTHEQQSSLFSSLLPEFLSISDASERFERTSELLARFGPWFDISTVLSQIPDSWAVGLVAPFWASALRKVVAERNETMLVKALNGAQNIMVAAELVEKVERLGPTVVPEMDTPNSGDGGFSGA